MTGLTKPGVLEKDKVCALVISLKKKRANRVGITSRMKKVTKYKVYIVGKSIRSTLDNPGITFKA
jgi:hypothetical protein